MTDYLEEKTGHGRAYWFARVQRLIGKHSKPIPAKTLKKMGLSPGHSGTDTVAVFADLAREIARVVPADRPVDGNMFVASTLAVITALWYARLQRAKCCDPVRPLSLRRKAYGSFVDFGAEISRVLIDERDDATFLPEQRWELPFAPDASSGSFK